MLRLNNLPLIFLFVAWLPLAGTLWPYPSEEAAVAFTSAIAPYIKGGEKVRDRLSRDGQAKEGAQIAKITDPREILSEWKINWAIKAIVFVIGITSIVLSFFRIKGWKLGLLCASTAYLTFISSFPIMRALHWVTWQAWWMMATKNPQWGVGVIYREIVFPFIHILIIAFIVVSLIIGLKRTPNQTLNSDAQQRRAD